MFVKGAPGTIYYNDNTAKHNKAQQNSEHIGGGYIARYVLKMDGNRIDWEEIIHNSIELWTSNHLPWEIWMKF